MLARSEEVLALGKERPQSRMMPTELMASTVPVGVNALTKSLYFGDEFRPRQAIQIFVDHLVEDSGFTPGTPPPGREHIPPAPLLAMVNVSSRSTRRMMLPVPNERKSRQPMRYVMVHEPRV